MTQLAMRPKLFQDIRKDFPGAVSHDNLKFWLIKRDFVPDAAEKATKIYLSTVRLAGDSPQDYDSSNTETEAEVKVNQPSGQWSTNAVWPEPKPQSILDRPSRDAQRPAMVQETFNLDEGPVAISVPSVLSPESYQDFADRVQILLRGLKRRSDAEESLKE